MMVNSARIISCFDCVVYGWTSTQKLDGSLAGCDPDTIPLGLDGPALEAILVTLITKATNNSMQSYDA